MWSESQFQDRLEMMRDGLNEMESKKQRQVEKERDKKLRKAFKETDDVVDDLSSINDQGIFGEMDQDDDFLQALNESMRGSSSNDSFQKSDSS